MLLLLTITRQLNSEQTTFIENLVDKVRRLQSIAVGFASAKLNVRRLTQTGSVDHFPQDKSPFYDLQAER